jgi:hypothetical protein
LTGSHGPVGEEEAARQLLFALQVLTLPGERYINRS